MIGITGATGVLGSILCKQFKQRGILYSVYAKDIRDFENLYAWLDKNKITKLIHLASLVAIDKVKADNDLAYDINVNGTLQLIKAIRALGKPIYVFFASSSHVYKSSIEPIPELGIIQPQNTYGLTKYISELLLMDFGKNFVDATVCIGRIFSFYHSSQKLPFLYPTLLQRFESEDLNKPFKLRGALSKRDFLNAEEVCRIIIMLIDLNTQGVFNIASGIPISIKDFTQALAPQKLSFEFDSDEETTSLVADISKLKTLINDY